mmetsp:Transcript_26430/g.27471  ORF Transcript_26430/g.27471 Transcript_26430/m.27471 type:complete len:385 (+) Transcript_26430:21-1175(+)
MGNCECLTREEETAELHVQSKATILDNDKDYDVPNPQARAGNKFILMDEDENNSEGRRLPDKQRSLVNADEPTNQGNTKPEIEENEILVYNNRVEILEEENNNKPQETKKEDDDEIQFATTGAVTDAVITSKQKAKVYEINAYKNYASNNDTFGSKEEVKPVQIDVNTINIQQDSTGVNNTQGEARVETNEIHQSKKEEEFMNTQTTNGLNYIPVDEDDFDCQQHSKRIFKNLNSFKTKLINLQNSLVKYDIPNGVGVSEDNLDSVWDTIREVSDTYKGKGFLWNEKGYNALRNLYQDKVDGKEVNEDIPALFVENNVGRAVEHSVSVEGKYSPEETAILLILKNSDNIKSFLSDATPFCAVCYVQGGNEDVKKGLTSVAFSKK